MVKSAPPPAPAAPPIPTTVLIAVDGNMSVGVEKRLADHPWWAAAASENNAMAGQGFDGNIWCMRGTSRMGTTANAQISMANLRPELTLWPRFIRQPESQPPPMEPTLETL